MDNKQMQKIKLKLGGKKCPICRNAILPYCNAYSREITEIEYSYMNEIDVHKDYTHLKCNICGYIMTFNTETLFR